MKKFTALLAIILVTAAILTGCGVAQDDYDSVVAQKNSLQSESAMLKTERDTLQTQYDALKTEHDALVAETADWLALSNEEKAAAAAKAEADRIAAEKVAQKAAEEKAAAEAEEAAKKAAEAAAEAKRKADAEAAEAKRKADEEKKGYETGITFEQLARNPDSYNGKKVKFRGEVIQVLEADGEIDLRIALDDYWNDIILAYYEPKIVSSRVLEGEMSGMCGGGVRQGSAMSEMRRTAGGGAEKRVDPVPGMARADSEQQMLRLFGRQGNRARQTGRNRDL
jgi:DNA polymerase III alpha subunit (gram-positive type)